MEVDLVFPLQISLALLVEMQHLTCFVYLRKPCIFPLNMYVVHWVPYQQKAFKMR